MQSRHQTVETAAFLRNARIGDILFPDQLTAAVRSAAQLPPIASYAIAATVPNWLVESLNPSLPMAPRYQVIPTEDRRDFLLLVTLQCQSVQLRCVLQLSDPLVQAFLSDALVHGLFTMLFSVENTKQYAVLGVPMDLAKPQELRKHLAKAKRCLDGSAAALQLVYLASQADFQPSYIAGYSVNDVIAILAGAPTKEEFEVALGVGAKEEPDNVGQPVH